MKPITFVFRTAPHGSASGREGLDALLATSAYSENLQVIFLGDGVLQLLPDQQPQAVLSKDYAPMFKLFDLYDIEQVFVCQASLDERGIGHDNLLIDTQIVTRDAIQQRLQNAGQILVF